MLGYRLPILTADDYENDPNYVKLRERLRKTLYYGKLPTADRPSLAMTEYAVELLQDLIEKDYDRIDMYWASKLSREVCATPCSLVIAMMYMKRLSNKNSPYLRQVSSSDLLLVAMMIASKFLYDEGEVDGVFNAEWAESANIDVDELNHIERNFLAAMNWDLFVSDAEFCKTLLNLEKRIAWKQGKEREGGFTYTDLDVLTEGCPIFMDTVIYVAQICQVIVVSCISYCACLATISLSPVTLQLAKTLLLLASTIKAPSIILPAYSVNTLSMNIQFTSSPTGASLLPIATVILPLNTELMNGGSFMNTEVKEDSMDGLDSWVESSAVENNKFNNMEESSAEIESNDCDSTLESNDCDSTLESESSDFLGDKMQPTAPEVNKPSVVEFLTLLQACDVITKALTGAWKSCCGFVSHPVRNRRKESHCKKRVVCADDCPHFSEEDLKPTGVDALNEEEMQEYLLTGSEDDAGICCCCLNSTFAHTRNRNSGSWERGCCQFVSRKSVYFQPYLREDQNDCWAGSDLFEGLQFMSFSTACLHSKIDDINSSCAAMCTETQNPMQLLIDKSKKEKEDRGMALQVSQSLMRLIDKLEGEEHRGMVLQVS